jgi:hypothetical protein
MKVQFGVGNSISTAFVASAKTVAVSNLTNADITPSNIEIYNTTRSAWMIGGDSTAVATVAITSVGGKPVFTLTLDKLPASSADGDALVGFAEIPDGKAIYNAEAQVAVNTLPA